MSALFPRARFGKPHLVRSYVHRLGADYWHGGTVPLAGQPGYTPLQIAQRYGFPAGSGSGVRVGYIAMKNGGNCGFQKSKLDAYLLSLGITRPPSVTWHNTDGNAPNIDGGPNAPSVETYLDLCICTALLPEADHHVFACENSTFGIRNMAQAAREAGCNFHGNSYGAPESYWSDSELADTDAEFARGVAAGMLIFCASGDNDSGDGLQGRHVDAPASCPAAIGVGGTSMPQSGPEVVWNSGAGEGTGGGISSFFAPELEWQSGLTAMRGAASKKRRHIPVAVTTRGVPDVAAVADPATGVQIVGGTVGGTSAGPWQWIGLLGKLSSNGVAIPRDFIRQLYSSAANAGATFDEVTGDNGAWWATTGWDACTGLGTPRGSVIAGLLSAPARVT